tara:strand:+ start:4443 stop:4718 length:276 start_codon:yes stop_codon:yes gene_type:complete
MARFQISRRYTMPKTEVRAAARELASKIEREYGLRAQWQEDSVSISGRGVDGALSFGDEKIEVSVKLGMLASLFESRLKHEIEKYLDENVA